VIWQLKEIVLLFNDSDSYWTHSLESAINKYLNGVTRIIEDALTLLLVLRAGSRIFECINTLLMKRTIKYKGLSLALLLPSIRCQDHDELDQKPRSCRYRFLSKTRIFRENHVLWYMFLGKSKPEAWWSVIRNSRKGHVSSNCITTSSCYIAYTHTIESATPVSYVHRVDSHPACNFRAEVLDPKNAVDIVQHL
jgi:hypothetical protein